jgi:hypothetical protein
MEKKLSYRDRIPILKSFDWSESQNQADWKDLNIAKLQTMHIISLFFSDNSWYSNPDDYIIREHFMD